MGQSALRVNLTITTGGLGAIYQHQTGLNDQDTTAYTCAKHPQYIKSTALVYPFRVQLVSCNLALCTARQVRSDAVLPREVL